MMTEPWFNTERAYATACILAGAAVAIVLAPKDNFFIVNAVFYWGPQVVALGILMPFSSRPSVVAGAAIVLALYLGVFGSWLFSRAHPESLAWLGYIFSLPGAAVGAIIGALVIKRRGLRSAPKVFLLVAFCTLAGLAVSQILVCSTVMYCLGG